jgi:hypothetical protein
VGFTNVVGTEYSHADEARLGGLRWLSRHPHTCRALPDHGRCFTSVGGGAALHIQIPARSPQHDWSRKRATETTHDIRKPRHPRVPPPIAPGIGILLPIIAAAVVVLLLLWAFVPSTTTRGVNDTTNAGPSAQAVTPTQSPSTSPTPTPNPTTEHPNTPPAQ